MRFDEAVAVARDVAAMIAEAVTHNAAADYLAEVLAAVGEGGGLLNVSSLVREGLGYVGGRRDWTCAILKAYEIWLLEINDPTSLGVPPDTSERHEAALLLAKREWHGIIFNFAPWSSRAEVMAASDAPDSYLWTGEYRLGVARIRELAVDAERRGRLGRAVPLWATAARLYIALGEFAEGEEARERAAALAGRLTEPSIGIMLVLNADYYWRLAKDDGWDIPIEPPGPGLGQWGALPGRHALVLTTLALALARMGQVEPAMQFLATVQPAIERAPAWWEGYPSIVCDAAETLWLTERTDHVEVIERNIREKVIAPDFSWPMIDGRLALARLCALQGRHDEARDWFAKARAVLDEQGARPLRAIVDYDEALMYARRGAAGDAERAQPLLDAALQQFRTLGMPGWIRRAEALLKTCAGGGADAKAHSP
jgi:tetratricopeptide (TPR) repeat protein